VAYGLSVTFVFRERRMTDRRFEFICFVAIGMLGLAVNQLVLVGAVEGLALSYAVGKAAAAGISFVVNFAARRALLFVDKSRGVEMSDSRGVSKVCGNEVL
jgi:putative flippase GtrA